VRRSVGLLIGGATVAALVGGALPAQAYAPAPVVIGAGHVDVVDVEYADGALEIGVHDETVEPDVEREPSDVVLVVRRQARATVPDDPRYAFLGTPGSPVWILPEIQNESLLWPGLSAEEIDGGVFRDDTVALGVEQVRGAGNVALYTEDAVGAPSVLVDSGDGLPDSLRLTVGGHLHANWAFDRPGGYELQVRATATLAATGATVTSEPVVYRFLVQR
jgi:surface-anchored protein